MKTRIVVAVVVVALGVGAAFGFLVARVPQEHAMSDGGAAPAAGERQALYWYDPMVPSQHFDKPGKSPFMDMQLVPKYADSAGGDDTAVRIQPGVVQNLGVRLTTVERGTLATGADAPGVIQYDQGRSTVVQTRVAGFVQGIRGRALGEVIEAGAPLVDLLVPAWAAAQAEFVALVRAGDAALIAAGKQRLLLEGMSAAVVAKLEKTLQPESSFTVASPTSGAIESLDVRPGMTVEVGTTVARIAGLDSLWVEASLTTSKADAVTPGSRVEVHVASVGPEPLSGEVVAVLPEASAETRASRVRVSVRNPNHTLRPGMFAQVRFDASRKAPALLVASESIIRSGTRNVVFVAREGRFTPVEVELGAEVGGRTEVVRGLEEGQQVVASGQFLIDSEANLQGLLARMSAPAASQTTAAPELHEGTGKVVSVAADQVTIAHGPIASMQWPAMTMGFRLKDTRDVKVGDTLHFWFRKDGDDFVIERVNRSEPQP